MAVLDGQALAAENTATRCEEIAAAGAGRPDASLARGDGRFGPERTARAPLHLNDGLAG